MRTILFELAVLTGLGLALAIVVELGLEAVRWAYAVILGRGDDETDADGIYDGISKGNGGWR